MTVGWEIAGRDVGHVLLPQCLEERDYMVADVQQGVESRLSNTIVFGLWRLSLLVSF